MKQKMPDVTTVFGRAVEIADPGERRTYLQTACGGDAELLSEVASLLDAHEQEENFLKTSSASTAQNPGPIQLPRRFGQYELLAEIARGGMGIVYKARQSNPHRLVALKMIRGGGLADPSQVLRFRGEVGAAASLAHPNIVGVHEVGESDGQPYYSMPFVEGVSLEALVEQRRWHSPDGRQAAEIVLKVTRAIQYAHEQGILHRDIKPANILLDTNREPYILDFGLAKRFQAEDRLTVTGDVLGSPSYMSPEQAAGHANEATSASDIYGLGAVLYYLLARKPPFVADSPMDVIGLVLEGKASLPRAVNPQIPTDLERICLRCLEKAPQKRYESAFHLAKDLESFLNGQAVRFPAMSLRERLWVWTTSMPGLVLRAAGLIASAVISEISFQLWGQPDPSQHYLALAALGLWLVGSVVCQRTLANPAWAERARFAWAALDALSMTAILLIDAALETALMALYPALVGISGLWMRVRLVLLTTVLAEVGYLILVAAAVLFNHGQLQDPPHWPVTMMIVLALEGLGVAYLVHRVSSRHRSSTGERI